MSKGMESKSVSCVKSLIGNGDNELNSFTYITQQSYFYFATLHFFQNDENGRGKVKPMKGRGRKRRFHGGLFLKITKTQITKITNHKNHKSQKSQITKSQITILHEETNRGSSDGAHFCCLPVELTKIFCEFVLDFVHPLHKSD